MPLYVHVGTHTQILDSPFLFSRFGQRAEVPDELAIKCRTLLPAQEFDAEGFTPDELKLFGEKPGYEHSHPAFSAFKVKRNAVWSKAEKRAAPEQAKPLEAAPAEEQPLEAHEQTASEVN